jgi:hypothetical protein
MLSQKQRRLILALMQTPTIRAACKRAGICDRTYRRWRRKSPEFCAALEEVRKAAFAEGVGLIKAALPRMSGALIRCAKGGRAADRIRAVKVAFDVVRSQELVDLRAEIQALALEVRSAKNVEHD